MSIARHNIARVNGPLEWVWGVCLEQNLPRVNYHQGTALSGLFPELNRIDWQWPKYRNKDIHEIKGLRQRGMRKVFATCRYLVFRSCVRGGVPVAQC